MIPNEIISSARLFWPFAKQAFANNLDAHYTDFDIYAKGMADGYTLASNKHKKDINDRELRIAQLMATIEELRG